MGRPSDLSGLVVHRLTVLHLADGVRPRSWVCKCACGGDAIVVSSLLITGKRKSCGCLRYSNLGDRTRKHGRANSRRTGYADRAYGAWQAMWDRCTNPNRADYHRYGGRGITVCAEWEDFATFASDMGDPPTGLTLDRIDNDGPYCKENCRWVSRKEQVYNSTQVRLITVDGVTRPLRQWLQLTGVSRGRFYYLLKRGKSPSQIFGGDDGDAK